jgi:two-component system sensor histidine kinase HydH
MVLFIDGHFTSKAHLEKIKGVVNGDVDEFGVSTVELFYNNNSQELYCILDAPDEDAVTKHHAKFGLTCNFITQIEKIHTKTADNTARLAAIGELAARLAHDLRNPLSVIKNTVEIMESKPKLRIEDRVIYYNRLHRAVDRISHQIEDVLDFVRPLTLTFEKHLVNDIISSAVEKITVPDSVKITLPNNFVYLVCDFTKLEVVFTNLIINAIQAMNNVGQVDIRIAELDKQIIIQVADTGCGIPQNILSKIFEPLFTTKQTGTGLGLASCKKIIEQHDGMIEIYSTEGQGTIFTIKLPKRNIVPSQGRQLEKNTLVS